MRKSHTFTQKAFAQLSRISVNVTSVTLDDHLSLVFQTSAPPSFILYLYWTMISLSVISLGKSPFQMCSTNNLVIRTKWVLPPSSAAHVRLLPSTIHFRISSFPLKWLHLLFIRHNLFPRNSSNPARGEVGRQSHSCNTVRYVLWYADRRGSVYRWAII